MFKERLEELHQSISLCRYFAGLDAISEGVALSMAHSLLKQSAQLEGLIYVIGNGGSASIASHFCTDLLRTLGLSALPLSDASILTCFANDFGYENVYKLPLMRTLRPQDLLVAISSSGTSLNILEAARLAKKRESSLITLSGFSQENPLRQLGDLNFWIESEDYGLIETSHFFLLHTLIDTFSAYYPRSQSILAR